MLRGRTKPENGGDSAAGSQPQFKENSQVARALVLNEVQKQDRQQKMQAGVMKKLDQNPEMKKALQAVVKDVPEDQREKVMTSMAMRAMRSMKPPVNQQVPAQGVKV